MKHTKHSAFSMVELVFVIVVLGIVASIGSSIIAKTFETYIIQKATYNASMKTEIAVQQIANRLSHAIPWTFVAKNPTVANPFNNFIILKAPPADLVHTALEWVGVDNDSFSAVTPLAGVDIVILTPLIPVNVMHKEAIQILLLQ